MSFEWVPDGKKAAAVKTVGKLHIGHALAKKVNVSRILRMMMVFKHSGVKRHYVGNVLCEWYRKKCTCEGHTSMTMFTVNRGGHVGA